MDMKTKNNTKPKFGAIYDKTIKKISKIVAKVKKKLPDIFLYNGNTWQKETAKEFQSWVDTFSKYNKPKSSNDIIAMYEVAKELYEMQYDDSSGPLAYYYNACLWITTSNFLDMLEYLIDKKKCTITYENYGEGKSASVSENEESNLNYDKVLLNSIKSNFENKLKRCQRNSYQFGDYDNQLEPSLSSNYIKDKIKALYNEEISKKADEALKYI